MADDGKRKGHNSAAGQGDKIPEYSPENIKRFFDTQNLPDSDNHPLRVMQGSPDPGAELVFRKDAGLAREWFNNNAPDEIKEEIIKKIVDKYPNISEEKIVDKLKNGDRKGAKPDEDSRKIFADLVSYHDEYKQKNPDSVEVYPKAAAQQVEKNNADFTDSMGELKKLEQGSIEFAREQIQKVNEDMRRAMQEAMKPYMRKPSGADVSFADGEDVSPSESGQFSPPKCGPQSPAGEKCR